MKRIHITFAAIVAAATSTLGAPHGLYSYGIGPYNNATNSPYTATFGYGAGYNSSSNMRSMLLGTFAGQDARALSRSVGLGYCALYGASNVTDSIAIGDLAGLRWRNATGWVQVGDAFAYTNGHLNIGNGLIEGSRTGGLIFAGLTKFTHGFVVGDGEAPIYLDQDGYLVLGAYVRSTYPPLFPEIHLGDSETSSTSIYGGNGWISVSGGISASGDVYTDHDFVGSRVNVTSVSSLTNLTSALVIHGGAGDASIAMDENGSLCLYTNGVKAGRISIVPDP